MIFFTSIMDYSISVRDENHMLLLCNKRNSFIKISLIWTAVNVINFIAAYLDKNLSVSLLIAMGIVALTALVQLYLMNETVLEISDETLCLYPIFGRGEPKVIHAYDVQQYKYYVMEEYLADGGGTKNKFQITYGANQTYIRIFNHDRNKNQVSIKLDCFLTQYFEKRGIPIVKK